jgi:hypothetical protein
MSDISPPGDRPLSEPERQAFQRLSLTPGHWAALVAAPFVSRRGVRRPLLRTRNDLRPLELLRVQLRNSRGLGDEAGRFWQRVSNGLPGSDLELARRLLAWHFATDLTYPHRFAFYDPFWTALEHFGIRDCFSVQDQYAVILELFQLVDQYLPINKFVPHEPLRVPVPMPPPAVLDAVARRIIPGALSWPLLEKTTVRFRLPITVGLLGEPVPDWWFKSDAPRWAVARGMASLPFDERERLYGDLEEEWLQVFHNTHGKAKARDCAARFISAVREWVDGVRFAVRRPELWTVTAPDPEAAARVAAPIVVAPLPPPPPAAPLVPTNPVVHHGPGGSLRAADVSTQPPARVAGAREIHPVRIPMVGGEPPPPPEGTSQAAAPPPAPLPPPLPGVAPAAPPSEPVSAPAVPTEMTKKAPPVPPPLPPAPPAKAKPERVNAMAAAPFPMVGLDAALARARAVPVADVCQWVDAPRPLLFDDCREEGARSVAVVSVASTVPSELWVVGDLHADILALANIISCAEAQAPANDPAHFLFLGDFVDRGIHDHEALLLLFRLVMAHPERVCIIPGNHDIDLQFDESAGKFRVTIEPAEYCEGLNEALKRDAPEDRERVQLAKAFIRFCATRPKAVFLPDGTLYTHGGFPHTDAQKDLSTLADLCKPRCLDDFLWARIAESARVKRPNRGSRGHEFGWDTLVQFCRVAAERLGLPVKRLVRGHDHVTDRWMEYPEYADNGVPVLTINAMGRLMDGEPARRDGRRHPLPVVGRHVPNHLPEVFALPLEPAEVDRAFNRAPPRTADPQPVRPVGETVDQLLESVRTRTAEPEPAPQEPPGGTQQPPAGGAGGARQADGREPGAEAAP